MTLLYNVSSKKFSLHEELLHGECVSIGIVLENELAILDKKFTADKQEIIKKVLQVDKINIGLVTKCFSFFKELRSSNRETRKGFR